VAKSKKRSGLSTDISEALAQQETPRFKWKIVLQIGAAFAVLWVSGFIVVPFVGYWAVGVVGVLTLVAAGFGVYVYRLTARSKAIVDIMKTATDEAGRQRAIEVLGGDSAKDAMKALAQAQLLAQTEPLDAMRVLEGIDIKKAPAVVQDDVRAQLAMLYLRHNKVREARELTDAVRLDRRPDAKTKALYAAVLAEASARGGNPEQARKLVETYKPEEADSAEIAAMLWRAQVFTFMALKKRGLAKQAMESLAGIEPNLVAGFLTKGASPELAKLARQVLGQTGAAPKMEL
jgi:hypothetical protein